MSILAKLRTLLREKRRIVFVSKQQRMQKRWSWIMGAITLVVSLFFPHFWGLWRVEGFFWQLLGFSPASPLKQVILHIDLFEVLTLFFPPCALTACTIWFWSRQMHWRPSSLRAMLVTLEATGLALLTTAVFYSVVFIIPSVVFIISAPGNTRGNRWAMGWGIAGAMFSTMWAGGAFLAFFPCLLIAATVLASLQRKNQIRLPDKAVER
jgi:hypothetical protein